MEKKLCIKRIVCLSVCLVLIVVACVIGYDFNAITAGEGNGTNAKISSMNEMGAMMSSFSKPLSEFDFSTDGKSDNDNGTVAKYSSVTFDEDTAVYVNSKTSYMNDVTFSTQTLQRYMRVCITPNATYYHSCYTLSSDAQYQIEEDGKKETKKSYSDITMDIEILSTEHRVLLRINKARIARDGKSLFVFERVIGQWGDFTEDTALGRKIVSSIGDTNDFNFRVLSLMGSYINNYGEGGFSNKGGSVYSMKDDTFKAFASKISSYLKDYSGGLEVDLSDSTEPSVSLKLVNDYEDEKTIDRYTRRTEYQYREYDSFRFSAINNTIVKGYDDISAISAERFNELIVEEEK